MSKKRQRTPRMHTPHAERVAIVAEIQRRQGTENRSVRALAGELGISVQTYYNWLRRDAALRQVVPAPAPVKTLDAAARARSARRYSERERRAIMEEIARRLADGQGIGAVLAAVDLGRTTYRRWQDLGMAAPPFRMVTLLAPTTPAHVAPLALVPVAASAEVARPVAPLTLVAPGGYRIEGLAVESAAALLRALS